ncbi:hypothetical protein HPB49_015412 [Dermacentor silvarum]|uniref:Uncharacterized protein n=1 Tax=Dermacentor silvarum TaxID=543639 RepID=A0ACB8E166_DERSI|nr:hypothetical protein HPB49_015412 [Dermacentor silvarum]
MALSVKGDAVTLVKDCVVRETEEMARSDDALVDTSGVTLVGQALDITVDPFQGDLQQLLVVPTPDSAYELCSSYVPGCAVPLPPLDADYGDPLLNRTDPAEKEPQPGGAYHNETVSCFILLRIIRREGLHRSHPTIQRSAIPLRDRRALRVFRVLLAFLDLKATRVPWDHRARKESVASKELCVRRTLGAAGRRDYEDCGASKEHLESREDGDEAARTVNVESQGLQGQRAISAFRVFQAYRERKVKGVSSELRVTRGWSDTKDLRAYRDPKGLWDRRVARVLQVDLASQASKGCRALW